jgi:hypothetical protein
MAAQLVGTRWPTVRQMPGRIKVSVAGGSRLAPWTAAAAGSNPEPATAATEVPRRQTEQLPEEIVWVIEVFRQARAVGREAEAVPWAGLRVTGAAVPLERAVRGGPLAWVVARAAAVAADGGGNQSWPRNAK